MIVSYPKDMYEGSMSLELVTDDGHRDSVSFGSGEPEDMNLARDLNDAMGIEKLVVLAYNAGKAGEKLEIVYEEEDDDTE